MEDGEDFAEVLLDLYSSPYIIRVIELGRIKV
jgi:hypothetical protein